MQLDRRHLAAALVLVLNATSSPAREVRIRTLPETPQPNVTTVVAPAARWAAVSEPARTLVVSHRTGSPAHVSVFRLDDQGQVVAGDPATVVLPKPPPLGDKPNHALGLACHPTLSLLYVWQDVPPPPDPMTIDPVRSAAFDHFLVYALDESPPRLVFAGARGTDYHCGNLRGGFALDKPGRRLYVPSMQVPAPMQKLAPAVGWLRMHPDGLPLFESPDAPIPESAESLPALDPAAAAASRAARLAAWEQSRATGKPLRLARHAESASYVFGSVPCPDSYAPVSDDAVLLASHAGAASWILSDRLGRFEYFFITPYIPYRYRVAAHPSLPVAYVTFVTYDGRIVWMEHADGHFTLTPRIASLDNVVIHSPPVVLAKSRQVVVGANGRVCFVALADDGRFTGEATQMTVNNPTVEALAWSEKLGRLYVPIEK